MDSIATASSVERNFLSWILTDPEGAKLASEAKLHPSAFVSRDEPPFRLGKQMYALNQVLYTVLTDFLGRTGVAPTRVQLESYCTEKDPSGELAKRLLARYDEVAAQGKPDEKAAELTLKKMLRAVSGRRLAKHSSKKWKPQEFAPSDDSQFDLVGNSVYKVVQSKSGSDRRLVTATAPEVASISIEANGQRYADVRWQLPNGKWHHETVPLEQLSDSYSIRKLSSFGLDVTSRTAGDLVDYVREVRLLHQDRIPEITRIRTSGWHNINSEDLFALSPKAILTRGGLDLPVEFAGSGEVFASIRQGGTLKGWKQTANSLADYPLMLVAFAASMATPFLKRVFELQGNPVIEFAGRSSKGKTSALQAAASVWGDPGEAPRYIRQWNGTPFAIQKMLSQIWDLPVMLDESTYSNALLRPSEVIYAFSNGQAKTLGRADGELRDSPRFSGTLFSTGERSLVTAASTDGIHARTFLFVEPPLGEDNHEFASTFKAKIVRDFGWAGPELIGAYLADQAGITAKLRRWHGKARIAYKSRSESDLERRKAEFFAAFGAIAQWAADVLDLRWDIPTTMREAWRMLESQRQTLHYFTAINSLIDWCITNEQLFEGSPRAGGYSKRIGRLIGSGKGEDTVPSFAVLRDQAEKVLKEVGYDLEAVLPYWVAEGWLDTDPERKTKKVRINGQPASCIQFSRKIMAERGAGVEEDAET